MLLTDFIPDCAAKTYLKKAIQLKDQGNYLKGLIEIRKAFFVEYERNYAIHDWADVDDNVTISMMLGRGGLYAPSYTKNKQWIEENVKCPLDYIQIDHEKIRFDAIEWGVSTSEVENLRRLTPGVIRFKADDDWKVAFDPNFPPNEANEQNLSYCLDLAINILLKKKEHEQLRKWPRNEKLFDPPLIYIDQLVYSSARTDSSVVHKVQKGFIYTINRMVSGFVNGEEFYDISGYEKDKNKQYGKSYFVGYLLKIEGEELINE